MQRAGSRSTFSELRWSRRAYRPIHYDKIVVIPLKHLGLTQKLSKSGSINAKCAGKHGVQYQLHACYMCCDVPGVLLFSNLDTLLHLVVRKEDGKSARS